MSDSELKDSPDHNPETADREEPAGCLDQINCIVRATVSGKSTEKEAESLRSKS